MSVVVAFGTCVRISCGSFGERSTQVQYFLVLEGAALLQLYTCSLFIDLSLAFCSSLSSVCRQSALTVTVLFYIKKKKENAAIACVQLQYAMYDKTSHKLKMKRVGQTISVFRFEKSCKQAIQGEDKKMKKASETGSETAKKTCTFSTVHSILLWLTVTVAYVMGAMRRYSMSTWSDSLVKEFQTDATGFATLSSAYLYTFSLLQIPCGIMLDVFGR